MGQPNTQHINISNLICWETASMFSVKNKTIFHLKKSRHHLINKTNSSPNIKLVYLHLEISNSWEKINFVTNGIKILGTMNYKYSFFNKQKYFASQNVNTQKIKHTQFWKYRK